MERAPLRRRGPEGPSPSGRALFTLAAAKQGLEPRDLPPSVSFFQGVRVEADGGFPLAGVRGPREVDLLAELPLVVLVANTAHPPWTRVRSSPGPLRIHAWRSTPTGNADERPSPAPPNCTAPT